MDLEVAPGVIAGRADLGGLLTHHDVAAVAALPHLDLALGKDLRHLHIVQQGAVTLLVVLLDGSHQTEPLRQLVEALLISSPGKALIHIRPLVVLALSGREEIFGGIPDAVQFLEPELRVLLFVLCGFEEQRRDLFDFAAAVDTKDPDLGNASGTAINFRYMDLDADCDSLGTELKDTFRRLKLFIDVYFQITGQGDFTNEEFDIVFNMDLPVNETDIINNAVNSNGLLSKRTILQNHPWVTDVDEELARIDEEKKAAMEEYGDGLFNHAMGADDSQEGGDSAGLNGGDGNDE